MRILVTGGAGFIGSHFCEQLANEGHDVVILDSLSTGRKDNISGMASRIEFINVDVSKNFSIEGDVDIIAHLASPASPADFGRMQLEILLANVWGTKNMLDLAVEKKSTFLLASTSEVYGDPLQHPQKENYRGNVNSIGPRSCYDESKRIAETLATIYSEKHGIPVKIARIFNTYGPRMRRDDGRAIPNFISHALQNKPLLIYGSGNQTRSFCYVSDMINGLRQLAFSAQSGVFNLGNADERKLIDVAVLVIKLCGSDSEIIHKEPLEDDPVRRCPDISKARIELGWHPEVSLEEGLKKTIEYARNLRNHKPV